MKLRKLTAILLCVFILAGVMSAAAYAGEDRPFYLVLGDSIGYGSGLGNSREAVYGKIVSDTNGYDYANDAIPGHTTQALLGRLEEASVKEHVAKADIISISIGGNNFLLGDLPRLLFNLLVLDDMAQAESIVEGFHKDFEEIISTIHTLNPDAVILIQTQYNPQTGHIGEAYQVSLDLLNETIRKCAEENPGEFEIVELASVLTPDDIAQDGIHPNVKGNEKIAAAVLAKLAELGLGENTEPVINTPGTDIRVPAMFTFPLRLYGDFLYFLGTIKRALPF